MTREKIMTELFEFSSPTYYKWKNQDKRKIFDLLNYAFSDDDLMEFLNTSKITKIEEAGDQGYLLDLSIKFYKLTRHITNYKIAKNLLILLEENYLSSDNKVIVEKIAEDIFKDEEFESSTKLALLNLIQRQEPVVLEYICKNRLAIERSFMKKNSRFIKKIDFLVPNIA